MSVLYTPHILYVEYNIYNDFILLKPNLSYFKFHSYIRAIRRQTMQASAPNLLGFNKTTPKGCYSAICQSLLDTDVPTS